MVIKFPKGYEVDINNVPDTFEEDIKHCFIQYTEGTSDKLVNLDKLSFIDLIVAKLHKSFDSYEAVKQLILDRTAYEIDESNSIPDSSEFYNIDFMVECYERGLDNASLDSHFGIKDHHIYEMEVQH